MPLEQKYAVVSGAKVFYLEGGRNFLASGTRIFLHGWGLSSMAFEQTIVQLSQHYHTIALDLPGFGRSDGVKSFWGYEAYAEFLARFIQDQNWATIHLLGQSMGGGVCLAVGALFPSHVKSLVLINSAGIPMKENPSFLMRIQEVIAQSHQSGYRAENWRMFAGFSHNLRKHPFFLKRSMQLPIKHDLRPLLHRIEMPCLLAWGQQDTMLPVSVASKMQKHLKRSKLVVIENGHHEWSAVYPEKLVEVVGKFYQEYCL